MSSTNCTVCAFTQHVTLRRQGRGGPPPAPPPRSPIGMTGCLRNAVSVNRWASADNGGTRASPHEGMCQMLEVFLKVCVEQPRPLKSSDSRLTFAAAAAAALVLSMNLQMSRAPTSQKITHHSPDRDDEKTYHREFENTIATNVSQQYDAIRDEPAGRWRCQSGSWMRSGGGAY